MNNCCNFSVMSSGSGSVLKDVQQLANTFRAPWTDAYEDLLAFGPRGSSDDRLYRVVDQLRACGADHVVDRVDDLSGAGCFWVLPTVLFVQLASISVVLPGQRRTRCSLVTSSVACAVNLLVVAC